MFFSYYNNKEEKNSEHKEEHRQLLGKILGIIIIRQRRDVNIYREYTELEYSLLNDDAIV